MTGPESPGWERWDVAARPPAEPGGEAPANPRAAVPPRAALAALAAAAFAALALPGNRIGLGATLTLVVLLVVSSSFRYPIGSRHWALVAFALAATATFRDATWVTLPALAGALAFGSLSLVDGRSWAGVARGLTASLRHAPKGVTAIAHAAPRASAERAGSYARGAALAAVLLAIFGTLFATGDQAFAQLAEDALPESDLGSLPLRAIVFAGALALAASLLVARRDDAMREPRTRLGTTEWLTALVALDLLFAAFVGVQLTVLFGKHEHVLQTAGLTYADYAKEGFAQLLVVAALTLAVIALATRYGRPTTHVRVALTILAALTFVVLASALHRLDLYQDAYGATRLRFAAHAGLLQIGAVLALVTAALATGRARWLPRATAAAVAAGLIAFAAVNPDRRIAERNLARGNPDAQYLRSLSADAAGALPDGLRRRPAEDGLFGFNLSRAAAR